ncbi:unnamed protein product [Polarella glacialis]|uniref:Uncharacterized protein n=1 Tax=Polarella glacialis TaxID=89957 RepID=A0A813HF13_POLGL|nr:unnamed protein product [Polarella glacialis]
MMSPAELFFGMDDSACSAMVSDLLQESDAEEQTDVPAEHSQDFTSEEERKERRSPSGETHRRSPAGIQSLGSVGLEFSRRPAPPGLTLLSTAAPGACGGLSSPSFPGCSVHRVPPKHRKYRSAVFHRWIGSKACHCSF